VASQLVNLQLPETLYKRLKQRAERTHRTIEDELLDVVATAVVIPDELPSDVAELIASLNTLSDKELWRAARMHLPVDEAEHLEALNTKQQHEGLSLAEEHTRFLLLQHYERAMLIRAQAAALLHRRGFDVANLRAA